MIDLHRTCDLHHRLVEKAVLNVRSTQSQRSPGSIASSSQDRGLAQAKCASVKRHFEVRLRGACYEVGRFVAFPGNPAQIDKNADMTTDFVQC